MKKGLVESNQSRFLLFFLVAIGVLAFSLLFFYVKSPTVGMAGITGNFIKYGSGPYTYYCSGCSDCTDALADANAGDTIYLNQSINTTINNCINITDKSNLIFDCQNNVISSPSNPYATGIFLINSNNSQIRNCNIMGFYVGVTFYYSNNNLLTNSHVESNSLYGLYIHDSYFNHIYNNIFNNTMNYYYTFGISLFNTTKTSATNIIGGSYIGGNFWATPTGTGCSQNCTLDVNNDKICDTPCNLSGSYDNFYDFLPLIYNTVNVTNATCTESWTCTNWTVCNISGVKIRNCTDSNSCGTNASKPTLNSTCTYSCTESWTCTNWTVCNISGIKIKNCTDANSCGTNTTKPALNSTCTYSANCTESWTCSDWTACSSSGIKTKTCADTNNCGTTTTRPALTSTCTYSIANESTGASPTEGIGTNVTHNVTIITPTTPAVINISDSQIYLTKIILNVLESIQSASVTVTKVNVLSDANLAMGLPSGQFYQGFRVDTTGVTDSNIANVTIEFKVNKLWLASKNGTAGGIGLYRKPDASSQWNSLVTSLTSQDSIYYYFTSVSPGFSTFAVFSRTCEGSECTTTPKKSALIYVVIAVVGVGIIIISYVLLRKIKKNQVVKKEVPKKSAVSPSYPR